MFRVICTQPVVVNVPRDVRLNLIDDTVAMAEKYAAAPDEVAIFDVHELGLKIVVQFAERRIHIMTVDEADQAGLPSKPSSFSPN